MADFSKYWPVLKGWEGTTYEDDPDDSGGCTCFGLTLQDIAEYHSDLNHDGNFSCEDVKALTNDTAFPIAKSLYWDFFEADQIQNQSFADFIVDGGYNQGRVLIAKYLQTALSITVDGKVGSKTLQAINTNTSLSQVFQQVKTSRITRYNNIVKNNPILKKYINGWLNRVNSYIFS